MLGHTTWHDSKTALLVFNRGTDTSTVLTGIDATVKAHANFKRAVTWQQAPYRRDLIANREKIKALRAELIRYQDWPPPHSQARA